MGHIPEDDDFEEYMNASSEEWSKPEEPSSKPEKKAEPTDRWGSPLPQDSTAGDENRWGAEPIETPTKLEKPEKLQKKGKWWIVVIVVLIVLCLCACVVLGALEAFQVINIF
jgi:hypothetical protein